MALYTVTRMPDASYPLFQVNRKTGAGTEAVLSLLSQDEAREAAKGLATGRFTSVEMALEVLSSEPEPTVCECEQDWNCPLHANRAGTWIETRYDHLADDERGF